MNENYIKLVKAGKIITDITDNGKLFIESNKIVAETSVEGLNVEVQTINETIKININLLENVKIKKPVYFCFGILEESSKQIIEMKVNIGKNSKIQLIGYCVFPQEFKVLHKMMSTVVLEEGSNFQYDEKHIHNKTGLIEVDTKVNVLAKKNSSYKTQFELIEGRVGKLNIDYRAVAQDFAKIEMTSIVKGYSDDIIDITENANLDGESSKAVLRSKIVALDNCKAKVTNTLIANGANSIGHVDCTEIIQGNGKVEAYPNVQVTNPTAHVTHEANLGGVDNKQLESIMARGLSKEEAENLIIKGLLS